MRAIRKFGIVLLSCCFVLSLNAAALDDVYDDEQDDVNDGVEEEMPANNNQPQPQIENIIEIEATGVGAAPTESCTPAQAIALAKRAAMVDAYRQLGEQMYGIQVNATDNVRNMVLKNSNVKTRLNAVVRGAQVTESSCQQGVCQVSMELKLDSRVWSSILGMQ